MPKVANTAATCPGATTVCDRNTAPTAKNRLNWAICAATSHVNNDSWVQTCSSRTPGVHPCSS